MIKGGKGGEKTITGLHFEKNVSFIAKFKNINGYSIKEIKRGKSKSKSHELYYEKNLVAEVYQKDSFYWLLENKGVHWKDYIVAP
ncbi:MAG: hypothetical protein OXC61_06085 [Flavobacteriaceae bacterium]|nr:hypothetical protein [Flavobacteriaceae bacterium]